VVTLTKQQRQAITVRAKQLVSERYKWLCSLSDAELVKLESMREQVEIDGVVVDLVTYSSDEFRPGCAVGALVRLRARSVGFWRFVGPIEWFLAHEAFRFVGGERHPFERGRLPDPSRVV
jgi:hypothetical protein